MTTTQNAAQQLTAIQQLLHQGQSEQALQALLQLQTQQPGLLACYQLLFPLLFKLRRLTELQQYARVCTELLPQQLLGYQALSMAQRFSQLHQQAIQTLLLAQQRCGTSAALSHQLGVLHKESGQLQAAADYLQQAIELNPVQADSWWQRADLIKQLPQDQLDQLQQLAAGATGLKDKASFYYSLFSAYDKAGLYPQAFNALQQGAEAKRRSLNYQSERELAELSRISLHFTPALLQQPAVDPTLGQQVIFILGMPRSGTTLVEQIISSHSDVVAGDELFELGRASAEVLQHKQLNKAYPDWAADLSAQDWYEIGQNYLKSTAYLQQKGRFTDKMPLNFKAIGLIHKALPGARIIHCRRNAMDTIWGCYRQLFAEGIAFSYDLEELKHYYMAYQRLMNYWQQQLPQTILTIDYELLVMEQQQQSKTLLQFLQLPWQEQCLDFHQNSRSVHTVSNSQVRQPMFQSSIGSWKKYQSQLVDFAAQLEQ